MRNIIPALIVICLALAGCAAGAGNSSVKILEAEHLFTGRQCGGADEEPSARWIHSEPEYKELERGIKSYIMGKPSAAWPEVDFSTHGVFLVAMGSKLTAGYLISLADLKFSVHGDKATLRLNWQEPKLGAILAQMLTSPCVLISLPKADFSKVRIIDQDGRIRAEALLP